jgi:predicted dehydrogenase
MALANGKHLLTEKPVAMNAGEVRQLMEAQGDRVVACCSSRCRFTPSAQAAAEVVARGDLGEIRVVHCRAIVPAGEAPKEPRPQWRLRKELNGGGILVNWGCYDLDYLLGLTGWTLKPRTAFAQTWPIPTQLKSHVSPGSDAETHFAALIRCEDGAAISIERGEYTSAREESAWRIVGSKGSLELHMTPGKKKIIYSRTTEEGLLSETVWKGEEPWEIIHSGPIDDFSEAVCHHRKPKTGLPESLILQAISDAVYASAQKGQAVEVTC